MQWFYLIFCILWHWHHFRTVSNLKDNRAPHPLPTWRPLPLGRKKTPYTDSHLIIGISLATVECITWNRGWQWSGEACHHSMYPITYAPFTPIWTPCYITSAFVSSYSDIVRGVVLLLSEFETRPDQMDDRRIWFRLVSGSARYGFVFLFLFEIAPSLDSE